MFVNVDLKDIRDDKRVLKNPHKGWYWHYVDNGLRRKTYRDKIGDYKSFPGLNHLYLRLDWFDIQPEPGVFDWSEVDRIIDEWGARGYRFALRVCCSETSAEQCFAVPKWLYDMGCGGEFYPPYPNDNPEWWEKNHDRSKAEKMKNPEKYCKKYWEPDYADPIFLKYLELFTKEYAKKFDNHPLIEYVDVGSYGNWGEGHNSCGSMRITPVDVYKKHVFIHMKYFKNKPVLVNDDFINQMEGNTHEDIKRWSKTKQELMDYCIDKGLGLRDDSILAGPDCAMRDYHTISTPEMFDKFYRQAPIDIEGDHYNTYTDEKSRGGLVIAEALRRSHATYAGFHGHIDDWLETKYYLTEYLANRMGYWYFINKIEHNDVADAGAKTRIGLEIENRGWGLCYNKYNLEFKLSDEHGKEYIYPMPEFDNRRILNETAVTEYFFIELDNDMADGRYKISVRLSEKICDKIVPIELALKQSSADKDGFYALSDISITKIL